MQAWDHWLSAHANGMRSSKEIVLVHLRCIASADSVEEFGKEVKILKEGEIWK